MKYYETKQWLNDVYKTERCMVLIFRANLFMKNQTQNELCDIETKVCKSQDILRVNDIMVCNEYMITKNIVTNSTIPLQNIILNI